MKFLETQIRGNWAEQYVSTLLANTGCLIRHVPQGQDSGIDLYCETILDGAPFHHFWCQVKWTSTIQEGSNQVHFRFTKKHLDYWIRQPIPVFMILVPASKKPRPPLFLFSPLRRRENGRNPRKSFLKLSSHSELMRFMKKQLPSEVALWDIQLGKVGYVRNSLKPNYTINFLAGSTPPHEDSLGRTLVYTLWRLSEDIIGEHVDFKTLRLRRGSSLKRKEVARRAQPYINTLETLVREKHIPQANYQVTFGLLRELKGLFAEAADFYREAISRIDGDPNLKPLDLDWRRRRAKWSRYLRRAVRKSRASRPA